MHRLLFIILLFATISTTFAQETDTTCPDDFEGYLSPRLVVGNTARVIIDVPLNMRPDPNTQQARIAQIDPYATAPVLDGPQCAEGYVWWQVEYNEEAGWIAEGWTTDEGEYWVQPRGPLVTEIDANGDERVYVEVISEHPDVNGFLEPVGCMRPPNDYTRVELGWATLNARTLFMLDNAQRIFFDLGGSNLVDFRMAIAQGSYNAGGVSASFGTHDAGGAVDISVRSPLDWSILEDDMPIMIEALRIAGFAAWVRDTGELYPDSPIHIHAIAVGDAELSPAAQLQIDSDRGYFFGFNGLPEEYNPDPIPDRHGGAVVCAWMIEDGVYEVVED